MEALVRLVKQQFFEAEGQDLVEYAMLLGFIALVAVAGVTLLGTNVAAIFQDLAGKIPS